MERILAIIGGMGPLASAEFVKTLYEFNGGDIEQETPACVLYSDPTFPDRTEMIMSDSDAMLISRLVKVLRSLRQLGISKTVICCITMHCFLPKVPAQLRENIISLIDLIMEGILNTKKRHLLLCTNGTRKVGIFQRHSKWNLAERYVTLPDDYDQNRIHNFIYKIKKSVIDDSVIAYLDALSYKYQVDTFIAGCTEIHLLTKYLMKHKYVGKNYRIEDPLLTLSKNLKRYIDA